MGTGIKKYQNQKNHNLHALHNVYENTGKDVKHYCN